MKKTKLTKEQKLENARYKSLDALLKFDDKVKNANNCNAVFNLFHDKIKSILNGYDFSIGVYKVVGDDECVKIEIVIT